MDLEYIALTATTCGVILSTCLNAAMWRKIGRLEETVRNSCPWGIGKCPSFVKAREEATGGKK